MKKLLAVVCLLSCLASVGLARGSQESADEPMYGIGTNTQTGMNALSLRYWQNKDWGVEGNLGYYTYSNSTNGSLIGGKYLRSLKQEKCLTIYGFAALAAINCQNAGVSASGTYIAAGLGVEFFFEELPNLRIYAEAGAANEGGDYYATTKGTQLFAPTVNNIGLHYYIK